MEARHPRFNKYQRTRYTGVKNVVNSNITQINGRQISNFNGCGLGMMPPPVVGSKFSFSINQNGNNVGSVFQIHKKGMNGSLPKSVVVDNGISFPRNTVLRSPTYQEYKSNRSRSNDVQNPSQTITQSQAKAMESYDRDQEYRAGDSNFVPSSNGNHEVGLSPNSFFQVQADRAADLALAAQFGKMVYLIFV